MSAALETGSFGHIGWGSDEEAAEAMWSLIERAGQESGVEIVVQRLRPLKRGPGIGANSIIWFDKERPPSVGRAFMEVLGRGEELDRFMEEHGESV